MLLNKQIELELTAVKDAAEQTERVHAAIAKAVVIRFAAREDTIG